MLRGVLVLLAVSFFILIMLTDISALRINEIDINPVDGKSGKEYIELYNDKNEEIDISEFTIYDGLTSPKKKFTVPEGTVLNKRDYYVIELSNALNNNGDFVTLYDKDGKKIDETEKLSEAKSSSSTWQYCDRNWEFLEETKEDKNVCEGEDEENTNEIVESNDTSENLTEEESNVEVLVENSENKVKTAEIIRLTPQTIKSTENKKDNKQTYAIYGLVIFCILLFLLFMYKNRKPKNEFR